MNIYNVLGTFGFIFLLFLCKRGLSSLILQMRKLRIREVRTLPRPQIVNGEFQTQTAGCLTLGLAQFVKLQGPGPQRHPPPSHSTPGLVLF